MRQRRLFFTSACMQYVFDGITSPLVQSRWVLRVCTSFHFAPQLWRNMAFTSHPSHFNSIFTPCLSNLTLNLVNICQQDESILSSQVSVAASTHSRMCSIGASTLRCQWHCPTRAAGWMVCWWTNQSLTASVFWHTCTACSHYVCALFAWGEARRVHIAWISLYDCQNDDEMDAVGNLHHTFSPRSSSEFFHIDHCSETLVQLVIEQRRQYLVREFFHHG